MEIDTVMASPEAGPSVATLAPHHTVRVNNLNEKVKLDVMKQSLKTLFKQYGPVLDVVAHSSIRMRGQAFISMATTEAAAKAVAEIKGFPLYGKPIQIEFAKTESDAVVKRKGEDFDAHKAERLQRKKISRRDNPLRRKFLAQKEQAQKAAEAALLSGAPAVVPTTTRRPVQMPDEYLPPNKLLFVQNLTDEMDKPSLVALFQVHPNLVEVRLIPSRKGIAFVEFVDEASSSVARDALHNTRYGPDEMKMKISFAKQ